MKNQIYKSAEVEKISATALEVRRSFNASADFVYKAFTAPSLIKRWMLGPPGWEMTVCEMDLKEGGKFRWRWKNKSSGNEFGFTGLYRKVETCREVVHTQVFDPGTTGEDMGEEGLVSVTFFESGGMTTVATRIEYQSSKDLDDALASGMTKGMEMSYKLLDDVIQTSAEMK